MEATTLSALGEPSRLRIVELLRSGPASVGEVAARASLRQPQASKHLRVLKDAGLVSAHAVARQRFYSLNPRPFRDLESWLVELQREWDERLDALDALLSDEQTHDDDR